MTHASHTHRLHCAGVPVKQLGSCRRRRATSLACGRYVHLPAPDIPLNRVLLAKKRYMQQQRNRPEFYER